MEELFVEVWRRGARCRGRHALPAADLRGGDAPVRHRQARPALRGMELATSARCSPTPRSGCSRACSATAARSSRSRCRGGELTRREFDELDEWAKRRGAKGLAWGVVEAGRRRRCAARCRSSCPTPRSPGSSPPPARGRRRDLLRRGGDHLRPRADGRAAQRTSPPSDAGPDRTTAGVLLGRRRRRCSSPAEDRRPDGGDHGLGAPVHHPFTAPAPEFVDDFEDSAPARRPPAPTTSCCNGYELGGGSIRIHDASCSARVFRFLGISTRTPRRSSASCCAGFATACRPTAGSRRGSTGW
jgi:aspartyl-tRNA synthetase